MNKSLSTAFSVLVILVSLVLVDFPYLVGADSADYIHFIDSGVTVYSPVNMTYYYGDLVLNVSLYSAGIMGGLDPSISMNFSIDGKYNGSIRLRSNEEMHIMSKAIGTAALPQLLNGSHCLTIYTYGLNQRAYEPRYLSFIDTVYFSTTGNPASTPIINPTLTATPQPAPSTNSKNPGDDPSSNPPPSANIPINRTMYAFDGSELLWSFNATAGSRIELNLTLTGDDSFETTFKIESGNHGTIYNSTLYGNRSLSNFTQTIELNYDDAYNITVGKHPFYSTVKIMGVIDLYPKETVAPTDSPTYSTTLSPSSSSTPTSSHNPSPPINNTQTANPTTPINTGYLPYTDEIMLIIIVSLALATMMVVTVILRKRKQTN